MFYDKGLDPFPACWYNGYDMKNRKMAGIMKERLIKILDYIEEHDGATTAELTEYFGVSEMTIRRDLIFLEKEDKIVRFHGGAGIKKHQRLESAFDIRLKTNYESKCRIAAKAAQYLENLSQSGQARSIFMGGGSTMYCMAECISEQLTATVVTDNLYVSSVLVKNPSNSVIIIGGQLVLPSLNVVGFTAEKMLSGFSMDYCFIGSSAIDEEGSLYSYTLSEAGFFAAAMNSAKHTVVLADHSKLGTKNLVQIARMSQDFTIITDHMAPAGILKRYQTLGAEVLVAESVTGENADITVFQ